MAVAPSTRRRYAPHLPPAERRAQLLDAALGIALERGFHAVTVDGVARAAGVTRPVVYGMYADRGALLHALVEREQQAALGQLAGVLPAVPAEADDADPDELLLAGLTAYLTAVRDHPRTWQVMLLPPEGAPVELAQRVAEQRVEVDAHLRALAMWGLPRNPALAGVDAEVFALGVRDLAEGAARRVLADPDRFPVQRWLSSARVLLAALRATAQTGR